MQIDYVLREFCNVLSTHHFCFCLFLYGDEGVHMATRSLQVRDPAGPGHGPGPNISLLQNLTGSIWNRWKSTRKSLGLMPLSSAVHLFFLELKGILFSQYAILLSIRATGCFMGARARCTFPTALVLCPDKVRIPFLFSLDLHFLRKSWGQFGAAGSFDPHHPHSRRKLTSRSCSLISLADCGLQAPTAILNNQWKKFLILWYSTHRNPS